MKHQKKLLNASNLEGHIKNSAHRLGRAEFFWWTLVFNQDVWKTKLSIVSFWLAFDHLNGCSIGPCNCPVVQSIGAVFQSAFDKKICMKLTLFRNAIWSLASSVQQRSVWRKLACSLTSFIGDLSTNNWTRSNICQPTPIRLRYTLVAAFRECAMILAASNDILDCLVIGRCSWKLCCNNQFFIGSTKSCARRFCLSWNFCAINLMRCKVFQLFGQHLYTQWQIQNKKLWTVCGEIFYSGFDTNLFGQLVNWFGMGIIFTSTIHSRNRGVRHITILLRFKKLGDLFKSLVPRFL